LAFGTGFTAGEARVVLEAVCAFFLFPRFATDPVVVLLFSDDALELELFALRVLRLRAIGTSGNAPTTGVAVFDVRPVLAASDAGTGTSRSMLSGSWCVCSSCFITSGSNGGAASKMSCGVDAPCTEVLSRTIPAACSSSAIALLLAACCTEWEDDGRRPLAAS
jgi:hypothetical protein